MSLPLENSLVSLSSFTPLSSSRGHKSTSPIAPTVVVCGDAMLLPLRVA
ncbi:hypothetical protein HanXRQr2_Chr01g0025821 [Helianthus annuus]|uniref:Uncharacterized protein n=1 Tax=Helianthus annuus TaxID=4232 RepID=A0A9K3P3T8_HELAN|nr:hypothetical protein HanXRQr2_Chr01g0025821 [Helianthus annuus]KAJ0957241.1 hypothetical protein HanPSC8_Chr01g0024941 [Helianthus annuus]